MAACTSEQEFFWKCHLCFATPSSDAARSRHMINLWKLPNDPTRCDNVQRAATIRRARAGHVPIINGPAAPSHDPVIAMARRPPLTWPAARRARLAYKVHATEANTDGARDMTILQARQVGFVFVQRCGCGQLEILVVIFGDTFFVNGGDLSLFKSCQESICRSRGAQKVSHISQITW